MSHDLGKFVHVPKVITRAHFVTNSLGALRYSRIGLIRARDAGLPYVVTAFPCHRDLPQKGEPAPMLPGLRFLFAAIVLATSILVFGLGAAALFRAAHEEFASIPARPAPREPQFAQHTEAAPVLAMLRVDPQPADKVAAVTPAQSIPAISEAAAPADVPPPAEPDKIAAVKAGEPASPAAPKSEAPAVEVASPAPPTEAAPQAPAADTSAIQQPAPAATDAAPAPAEPKLAAVPEPPAATVPAIAEPAAVPPPSPEAIAAETRIATLGGPEVAVAVPAPAKAAEAKRPDHSATSKAAHRKERRRIARARQARQAVVQQQAVDPFGQPTTITTVQPR